MLSVHRSTANEHADFANMLNEMRLGKLSNQSVNTFKSLNRELKFDDDIRPTEL